MYILIFTGHWRNQVLKLLTEKQLMERAVKKKDYDFQLQLGLLNKQLEAKDDNMKTWQDRYTAANLKARSLQEKILLLEQEKLQLSLHTTKEQGMSVKNDMDTSSDNFTYMRDVILECRRQV